MQGVPSWRSTGSTATAATTSTPTRPGCCATAAPPRTSPRPPSSAPTASAPASTPVAAARAPGSSGSPATRRWTSCGAAVGMHGWRTSRPISTGLGRRPAGRAQRAAPRARRSRWRTLAPRERELVALKFFAGLSNAEIGRVLGISESNVGTSLHRTMDKLREASMRPHSDDLIWPPSCGRCARAAGGVQAELDSRAAAASARPGTPARAHPLDWAGRSPRATATPRWTRRRRARHRLLHGADLAANRETTPLPPVEPEARRHQTAMSSQDRQRRRAGSLPASPRSQGAPRRRPGGAGGGLRGRHQSRPRPQRDGPHARAAPPRRRTGRRARAPLRTGRHRGRRAPGLRRRASSRAWSSTPPSTTGRRMPAVTPAKRERASSCCSPAPASTTRWRRSRASPPSARDTNRPWTSPAPTVTARDRLRASEQRSKASWRSSRVPQATKNGWQSKRSCARERRSAGLCAAGSTA